MSVWFTADLHFNHGNIIKYLNRPFMNNHESELVRQEHEKSTDSYRWPESLKALHIRRETVRRHDEAIASNINTLVAPEDVLWILGDFCFGTPAEWAAARNRINCQHVNLIVGNHDEEAEERYGLRLWDFFEEVYDLRNLQIEGQKITLCHYAMDVWHKSHRGAFHVYGHTHGNLPLRENKLSCDVGVDAWDFKPVSMDQIREVMLSKKRNPDDLF